MECDFCGMDDLGSWMIRMGTNTNSVIWFKSSLGSRASFDLKVESKSRNWDIHSFPINGMWLSKKGGSISRFVGTRIDVGLEMWSNLGKDTWLQVKAVRVIV